MVSSNDGLDYVPTNKRILFGHHFAAIAGTGPLIGLALAAQIGYLPGTLWLIAGVVFAGAAQDFMVLLISSRHNGRSLGELMREEMSQVAGAIALFDAFPTMITILAVLTLVVVKTLADGPWGMFTVLATISIAPFMDVYIRFIRPDRIGEILIIGVLLLLGSIWLGGQVVVSPEWVPHFTFSGVQITWMLIGYGAVASALPVWLSLAPCDHLSTFLKIGTIIGLVIGILIVTPELKVPAPTQFANGIGPVWKGSLFPSLFITITCGAVSGFHALISSGVTPKLLNREPDTRYIGYGGMLMESFVVIMAMVAVSVVEPGIYFVMNSPPAVVGAGVNVVAAIVSSWGFTITSEQLIQIAQDIGEITILARAGGVPTLAVGIAHILHQVLPGENIMAFWYHFATLLEALFVLTAVDAGVRAGCFMLQDLLGNPVPALKKTESRITNIIGTGGCVALWGWLLYQGVADPLSGINILWPLFGVSNQMLTGTALMLATVVLIKMKRQQYVWVTILSAAWLLICTTTAGLARVFDSSPTVGFVAFGGKYTIALDVGQVLAPAKDIGQMQHVVLNAYINAGLAVLFLLVVFSVLFYAIKVGIVAWGKSEWTDKETPFEPIPDV